jgi:hypothetical protein
VARSLSTVAVEHPRSRISIHTTTYRCRSPRVDSLRIELSGFEARFLCTILYADFGEFTFHALG